MLTWCEKGLALEFPNACEREITFKRIKKLAPAALATLLLRDPWPLGDMARKKAWETALASNLSRFMHDIGRSECKDGRFGHRSADTPTFLQPRCTQKPTLSP